MPEELPFGPTPGSRNPTLPGGAGGGRGVNIGGFQFGQRFGNIGASDLSRLGGFFGPDFTGRIRAGDLRRGLSSGQFGGDSDFINTILGNLGEGPGFSGVGADGTFQLGNNLDNLLSPRETERLQSILSQRPNLTSDLFKGGRVNFPDLRRLFNELQVGQAKDFVQDILVRSRAAGIDDVSQDAGSGIPGDGGGGGLTSDGSIPASGGSGGGIGGGQVSSLEAKLLETILNGLKSEGFPDSIVRSTKNQIIGQSKGDLRDSNLRATERLAARGFGDSGLGERTFEGIEDAALNRRNDSLDSFSLENARVATSERNAAREAALSFLGLEQDEFFGLEGIRLGEEGLANESRGLDLTELDILLRNQIEEILRNLGLGGLLGFSGTTSAPVAGGGLLEGLVGGGGSGRTGDALAF